MGNIEILLVEDNPDDASLTIRALQKHNLANKLFHAQNGEEALNFLFDPDRITLPKLILLDIRMPKVDGFEVLRKIKSDENLKIIPIVMFTSSKQEQDVIESYNLGVNSYILKPVAFDLFMKTIADLGQFWMMLNQPPRALPAAGAF